MVLARVLAIALLGIGLFAVVTFLACNRRLAVSYVHDLTALSRLQEQLPAIVMLTAAVQAAAVGGLTLLCALVTGQAFEEVRFRKTDQLHGLADALRQVRAACDARRQARRESLAQADRLLEECTLLTAQGRATPALLAQRLTSLRRVYEEMAEPTHQAGPG
jgi:hypothetical protein